MDEEEDYMSLKQECIDMFKLIFQGLEDYEDYDIEENTGVFLCPKNDYKDTDLLLSDCYEQCHTRDNCTKELIKTDLSIFVPYWAGDEDGGTIYINFNKKPKKEQYRNTIRYINNRKQLINLMYEMKQRVDDTKNAYAEYAEKIIELRKYGQVFLQQLQKDYPVFKNIKAELPIVFDDFEKDENGQYVYDTGGNFVLIDNVQLIIHVYDCWRDIESLKRTVRHEILHYVLFRISVNNSDDGGIFHYFCNKYDAHAYKEMPEDEQEIYKMLINDSEKNVSDVLERIKRKIILGYAQ